MARYRAGLRKWRQRIKRLALGFALVVLAATLIPALVTGQAVGYYLGAFGGSFIGLYLWLRDDPPHYVANWRSGAEAERRTARALRRLVDAGWYAVHDVPCQIGNMDHVVIGPAGVFVLETKCLGGTATVVGDELRVRRTLDPDSDYVTSGVARRARGRAAGLSRALATHAGHRCWVQAAVVIDQHFDTGVEEAERVAFVARDQLADWLAGQPVRLEAAAIDRLAAAMRTLVARADAGDDNRRQRRTVQTGVTPFIIGSDAT